MSDEEPKPKSMRGFASMDRAKQLEIASKGGRTAHEKGTAHQFTSQEASAAGRKGGSTHSSEHMAAIGRIGGAARGRRSRKKKEAAGEDGVSVRELGKVQPAKE